MNQTTRRVALSDPHYRYSLADGDDQQRHPHSGFLIANAGQSSGDLRWYDYDPLTGRDRTRVILSDLTPPFRASAWSRHPSHDCVIACGVTSGRINLHDLTVQEGAARDGPSSTTTNARPFTIGATGGLGGSYAFPVQPSALPIGTTISSSMSSTIGGLARDQTRTCTCLAWFWPSRPRNPSTRGDATEENDPSTWSRGNPSYLAAGYDKARSDPSLLIWDAERLLSSAAASSSRVRAARRLSASAFEVDRLTSNLPPLKEKEVDTSGNATQASGGAIKRGRLSDAAMPAPVANKDPNRLDRPLQQYLSGEIVNSLDTFPQTIYELLASYGSKNVRLIDLRVPVPSGPAPSAPTQHQSSVDGARTPTARSSSAAVSTPVIPTEPAKSISWRASTKAVYNLAICPERPWLFASSEEGLAGIVRVWDLRYAPSSLSSGGAGMGSGGGVASGTHGGVPSVGEVLTIEAGRGGVASLKWDAGDYLAGRNAPSSGWNGASKLGVGTSTGGVLIWDVISGRREERTTRMLDEGCEGGSGWREWSVLAKVRGTEVRGSGHASGPLQSFTFLPSERSSSQSIVSIHRDGNLGKSHVRAFVPIAAGQQGDLALGSDAVPFSVSPKSVDSAENIVGEDTNSSARRGRAYLPLKAQALLGVGPREAVEDVEREVLSDALADEVGLKMRAKAEAGFGMLLLGNDVIEERLPTSDGFLWEWLDRFVKLLGKSAITGVDEYDFALQGICGIWEAAPLNTKAKAAAAASRSESLLLPRDYESGGGSDWNSTRTPTNRSPSSGNRRVARSEDVQYTRSIGRIIEGRRAQFQDTTTLAHSSRSNHRQLMLAICGELSGSRLDKELLRIAETNLTKAACLTYLNRGLDPAVALLQQSTGAARFLADETHRLVAMLLQSSRLDPKVVSRMQLHDGYLRTMIKFKAEDSSWDDIIKDPELPLLERLVLALKFVNDEKLSTFLKSMADTCVENGSLHGIVLVGLVGRGPDLISRYVDRTGDIQSAAILSAYMHRKSAMTDRWIEQYRDLLDSWKLYAPRIAFDMGHGQIAKANSMPLHVPPQVLLRCNFCQKVVTKQAKSQAFQNKVRATCCQSCGNRLPRCCICLLHIEAQGGDTNASSISIKTATMFCQTCFHGGHYDHIARWFFGSEADDEESHETCAVSGCNCKCASL